MSKHKKSKQKFYLKKQIVPLIIVIILLAVLIFIIYVSRNTLSTLIYERFLTFLLFTIASLLVACITYFIESKAIIKGKSIIGEYKLSGAIAAFTFSLYLFTKLFPFNADVAITPKRPIDISGIWFYKDTDYNESEIWEIKQEKGLLKQTDELIVIVNKTKRYMKGTYDNKTGSLYFLYKTKRSTNSSILNWQGRINDNGTKIEGTYYSEELGYKGNFVLIRQKEK